MKLRRCEAVSELCLPRRASACSRSLFCLAKAWPH